MFAITYSLSTGTVLHRSKSAADALEAMKLLQSGGGVVLKILVTRTGEELSVAELQLMARRENSTSAQKQETSPRFPWFRRVKS